MSSDRPPLPDFVAGHSFPVLMFDGECGLCQRLVRWLMRLDRAGRLRYAPLQGRSAQEYLQAHGLPTVDFDTLVFVPLWGRREQREFLVRTAGAIAALRAVDRGGARWLAKGLSLVPSAIRDAGYRLVARVRYAVFGPWRPRPWPRPEWAARILE